MTATTLRFGRWAALLAVFLLIFGARLWLIQTYGNATPYWDQWDAEAAEILQPWREGRLAAANFLSPHAEHRIVFSRLETLGLTWLDGQWDPLVEMVVNAALAAAVAAGVAVFLGRHRPPGRGSDWLLVVAALVAALFSLPFAWENTLAGFQGQFYFLLGFTIAALAGLGLGRPGSAGWWAGALAAVAACFSMASGFTAAGVALGWRGLRLWRDRRRPDGGEWTTATVCLAVVALGLALRHDPPSHAVLKAEDFAAWVRALGRCLAWPWVYAPGWGAWMWLPWFGLALGWLRRRRSGGAGALLLLGTWLLVQSAAMAYARGGHDEPPVSRYFDLLGLGAVVNVLAGAWLLAWTLPGRRWPFRAAALGTATLWLGFLGWGVVNLTRIDFGEELPRKRAWGQAEEVNVRAYVATGDRAHLLNKPFLHIPYPDAARLATLLDDPGLRALLPANLRVPLRLVTSPETTGFVADGVPPATDGAPAPGRPALGSYDPAAGGAAAVGTLRATLSPTPALPYLRWEFAGRSADSSQVGLLFSLSRGDMSRYDVRHLPGDRWRVEHLPVPGGSAAREGELQVLAEDRSPTSWIAFRGPTEEGALSFWAGWLTRRGAGLCGAGGLVAVGSLGAFFLRGRRRGRHVEGPR